MPWPNSQQREVEITVENTLTSSALTDYPVLLTAANLPAELLNTSSGNSAQSGGGDIRAGSSRGMGTQYSIEVVDCSPTAGGTGATAEIWVKVPSVPSGGTTFWLAWNTAGTTSADAVTAVPGGRNDVWADFLAVYHGDDTTDSTGNGQTLSGTNSPTSGATGGKIGDMFSFSAASSEYFNASLATGGITCPTGLSAWVKRGTLSVDGTALEISDSTQGNNDWMRLYSSSSGKNQLAFDDSAFTVLPGTTMSTGTWYHTGAMFTSTTSTLLFNGTVDNSASETNNDNADSDQLSIGALVRSGPVHYWNGDIDEARFYPFAASTDWMLADYRSQNDPATYVTAGTPVAPIAAGDALLLDSDLTDNLLLDSDLTDVLLLQAAAGGTTSNIALRDITLSPEAPTTLRSLITNIPAL